MLQLRPREVPRSLQGITAGGDRADAPHLFFSLPSALYPLRDPLLNRSPILLYPLCHSSRVIPFVHSFLHSFCAFLPCILSLPFPFAFLLCHFFLLSFFAIPPVSFLLCHSSYATPPVPFLLCHSSRVMPPVLPLREAEIEKGKWQKQE